MVEISENTFQIVASEITFRQGKKLLATFDLKKSNIIKELNCLHKIRFFVKRN